MFGNIAILFRFTFFKLLLYFNIVHLGNMMSSNFKTTSNVGRNVNKVTMLMTPIPNTYSADLNKITNW
jgi:hypothetical protein